jgi:hypothetical protein
VARLVRNYLAKVEVGVQGQNGRYELWRVCQLTVNGYWLWPDEAEPFVTEWGLRCVPPWRGRKDEEYIRRELNKALREGDRNGKPRGYMLKKYAIGRVETPEGWLWVGVPGYESGAWVVEEPGGGVR